jgi:RimJ/RimL family protein N-acetyltransferase
MVPTVDELREVLARRDIVTGSFFVVEDQEGEVRGCGVLRAARIESEFAEVIVGLADDADYATPLADDVLGYLRRIALVDKKLNKVVTYCLLSEQPYRDLLVRHGFQSDGVQRQIMYTLGRYHDLESLSLFRAGAPAASEGELHEPATAAT